MAAAAAAVVERTRPPLRARVSVYYAFVCVCEGIAARPTVLLSYYRVRKRLLQTDFTKDNSKDLKKLFFCKGNEI